MSRNNLHKEKAVVGKLIKQITDIISNKTPMRDNNNIVLFSDIDPSVVWKKTNEKLTIEA